ncbi:MAG: hypothetical protein MJ224_08115 [archaeon]|nr:hypothetical protein [archaeon]
MKIDVDIEKLLLRLKELVNYDGYLPWLIRARMPITVGVYYKNNLSNKGLLDNYVDRFIKSKIFTWDETIEEFNEWIKDNPKFKDLLIYVEDGFNPTEQYEKIPKSYRFWISNLTYQETGDKERMLQRWYDKDPEHFNEWLEWAKDITGPELFEGTSFE